MMDLRDACVHFLKRKLSPTNCFAISALAIRYECKDLERIANYYVERYFSDAVKTECFLSLTMEKVIQVITNPRICTSSEEEVFECVIAWINNDLPERQKFIADLMQFVKLPLLSDPYLKQNVKTEPLFSNNFVCLQYLTEAFEYNLLESQEKALINTYRTKRRRSNDQVLLGVKFNFESEWKLECLDVQKKQWMKFAECHGHRMDGVVAVRGMLYIFCTSWMTWKRYIRKLDCDTNTWSNCSKMNTDRHWFSVASLNNLIYAVGGTGDDRTGKFLNSAEVYDPDLNTWSTIAPMSIGRAYFGLCAVDEFLYAVGGMDDSDLLSSVERYCPQSDTWTTCADMDYKISDAGVACLNGLLYVAGGMHAIDSYSTPANFQVYTPELNVWRSIADKGDISYQGLVTVNNLIYLVCGNQLNKFHIYDPTLNEWNWQSIISTEEALNQRGKRLPQMVLQSHTLVIDAPLNVN